MFRIRLLFGLAISLAVGFAATASEIVKLKLKEALYVDAKGGGLREPYGVACASGSIVVADSGNGRLVVYDVTERGASPRVEIVRPEVPFPIRVAIAPSGEILALDGRSLRIARLDASGDLKGWLEPSGGAAPGPAAFRSLAVGHDGRVYLLDVSGGRVIVLDPVGTVQRTISLASDRGFPSDLAVDGRGDVYVVDSVRRRVDVARKGDAALAPLSEKLHTDVDFPTAVAVDGEGRLFLVDENGGGIVVLGRDGSFHGRQLSMGWKGGFLRYPAGVCADPSGNLVVADRGNNRVQVFAVAP